MDVCMGMTVPKTLEKNGNVNAKGRLFGTATSVYFYLNSTVKIEVAGSYAAIAALKCHP
jgi:hypothetical protein